MARTRTVHTRADTEMLSITIPRAQISLIGRVDATSASAKFRSRPSPAELRIVFEKMGWSAPGKNRTQENLVGKFQGGNFILSAKLDDAEKGKLKLKSLDGKLDTEAEIDIEYESISGFQCLRMEIEGKRGKGFRFELRFSCISKSPDFAANLESYMLRTDNARGSLQIYYLPEAKQTPIGDCGATEEQRDAQSEIETE